MDTYGLMEYLVYSGVIGLSYIACMQVDKMCDRILTRDSREHAERYPHELTPEKYEASLAERTNKSVTFADGRDV